MDEDEREEKHEIERSVRGEEKKKRVLGDITTGFPTQRRRPGGDMRLSRSNSLKGLFPNAGNEGLNGTRIKETLIS